MGGSGTTPPFSAPAEKVNSGHLALLEQVLGSSGTGGQGGVEPQDTS